MWSMIHGVLVNTVLRHLSTLRRTKLSCNTQHRDVFELSAVICMQRVRLTAEVHSYEMTGCIATMWPWAADAG